jgi:geranylgeranyl reductase family protein
MKTYDLLILGGGPSGSFLGYLLAKEGLSVAIVDAQKNKKRKICGEYLCPKGVEILWKSGLSSVAGERTIEGMRLVSPSGKIVNSKFPANSTNGGRAIQRDIFDSSILQAAKVAGCDLFLGEKIDRFQSDGTLWTIQRKEKSLRARFLVGADGRQSIVAKKMGVEIPQNPHRVALHAYLPIQGAKCGEMHILEDGAYIGINPTGDNELNVSLVCDSKHLKAKSPLEVFQYWVSRSRDLSPRLLKALSGSEIFVTSPITHIVKSVSGNRWALIGDAAGFLDPLTGEGIFQALISAECFANAFLAERKEALFPQIVPSYEKFRKSIFWQKRLLNQSFQLVIRSSFLSNSIATLLQMNQKIADTFIGIIGNIFTPTQALKFIWKERFFL